MLAFLMSLIVGGLGYKLLDHPIKRGMDQDSFDKAIITAKQPIHYPTDGSYWQDHTGIGK